MFALFCFVFEGKFQVQAPWGSYIWRGDLTEGLLRYGFGGLIHGGAYFRNFTVFGKVLNYTQLFFFWATHFGKRILKNIKIIGIKRYKLLSNDDHG